MIDLFVGDSIWLGMCEMRALDGSNSVIACVSVCAVCVLLWFDYDFLKS